MPLSPINKLLVITGPTGSGKTSQSFDLARKHNGVVISSDSRMVYQGLDIGTGKTTWEYRTLPQAPWLPVTRHEPEGPIYTIQGIEHELFDCVLPEIAFSLTDWLTRARKTIGRIKAAGQRPMIVGGTGLYIKALLEGYEPPPTDPRVRTEIERLSTEEIITQLKPVDPAIAMREAGNRRRLVRALEVYRLTGQPQSQMKKSAGYPADVIILTPERNDLYDRIDQRVNEWLENGLVEEVEGLLDRGVSQTWLESIGLEYRIVTEWLASPDKKKDELAARLGQTTRAYARRQMTYLRTQLGTYFSSVNQLGEDREG